MNKTQSVLIFLAEILGLVLIFYFPGRIMLTQAGPSSPVLTIRTLDDYFDFAESVHNGNTYEGQYVNLDTDLDFSGTDKDPTIGNRENTQYHFKGIFDGNAHHIQNLNLYSDSEAGLFLNLDGTVCNLQIDSGSITGTVCGAIAPTAELGSSVLNCASYAQIYGDTTDGLVGKSQGTVQNCRGPSGEAPASSLNQGLGGLGGSSSVDDWYFWETVDNRPSLSSRTANTVASIRADLPVELQKITLYAYYSTLKEVWQFALPAGYEDSELYIDLTFSDNEQLRLHRQAGAKEVSCEMDSIFYSIEFSSAKNAPSLLLHTSVSDALLWLHADKENQLPGTFTLLGTDGAALSEGRIDRLKGHGNDSWKAPKKSYNLTFHQPENILHMGAAKDYVLLAAYRDNSLLSYKVTHDLCREIGMDFAPASEFVHLYVDGNYLGMYVMTGKIEVGENRFHIKDLLSETKRLNRLSLNRYERREWASETTPARKIWFELSRTPEDVTGGYILELDNEDYDPEKSLFVSDRDLCIVLRSQPYASREQVDYIAGFWQDFEDALYGEGGYNAKGKHYTEYIDLESFADQWLIYELNEESSLNSSIYFYKDSAQTGDGKIHASWSWDMEHSLARSSAAATSWFAGANVLLERYWMQFYAHRDFRKTVFQEWTDQFVPALEKALQEGGVRNPDGISSLNWYLAWYRQDGYLNQTRWPDSDYEGKLKKIQDIYSVRKDFLTKALSLYDSGYAYFYEEDGVFYGVTDNWEEVPVDFTDL